MSCSTMDLKAFLLGEADRREKAEFESHLSACPHCREELERLQLTHSALLSVPDQEIPQRIAFVSDRVFEPRWWQTLWRSGPAAIFASAVLVAAAILVHAAVRPAPVVTQVTAATVQVDSAKLQQRIEQEVDRRVQTAVARAVADLETRQTAETARIAMATRKHVEAEYRPVLAAAQQAMNLYQQQMARLTVAANYPRSEPQ